MLVKRSRNNNTMHYRQRTEVYLNIPRIMLIILEPSMIEYVLFVCLFVCSVLL